MKEPLRDDIAYNVLHHQVGTAADASQRAIFMHGRGKTGSNHTGHAAHNELHQQPHQSEKSSTQQGSISNHTNQTNLPLSMVEHIKNFVTISNITSPLVCQSNIGREQPCRQTMIPCSLTKRQKDMLMYNIATLVSC